SAAAASAASTSFAVAAISPRDHARLSGSPPRIVVAFSHEVDASLLNETTLRLEIVAADGTPSVALSARLAEGNPSVVLLTPQRLRRCVRADSAAGAPHRHRHRHLGGTDRALPRARRRPALRRLRPARAAHPHARWVTDAADARLPRSECDPRSPARVRRRAG